MRIQVYTAINVYKFAKIYGPKCIRIYIYLECLKIQNIITTNVEHTLLFIFDDTIKNEKKNYIEVRHKVDLKTDLTNTNVHSKTNLKIRNKYIYICMGQTNKHSN